MQHIEADPARFRPTPVRRKNVRMQDAGCVRLLDADPELGCHLDERARRLAARVVVAPARSLSTGRWCPAREEEAGRLALGALVIDGLLTRRVRLAERHSVELLGCGDILRPHQAECDEFAFVRSDSEWRVLQPTTVALIDDDVVAGLAGLPGVLAELAGRLILRSRTLAVRLAIAQIPQLDLRLQWLFWHLADRWGKTSPDGVVLPLRLSQDVLADLVCARRSSVNGALRALSRRGALTPRSDRTWLLTGDPPPGLTPSPGLTGSPVVVEAFGSPGC